MQYQIVTSILDGDSQSLIGSQQNISSASEGEYGNSITFELDTGKRVRVKYHTVFEVEEIKE